MVSPPKGLYFLILVDKLHQTFKGLYKLHLGGFDMLESQRLGQLLKELEEKRKSGALTAGEFYKELLNLLADLKDTLVGEDVDDKQIRRQIPLLLTFLKAQIKELSNRGN